MGTVTIAGLTIASGVAAHGGGVLNTANLSMTGCTLSNDSATLGGGVFNSGTLSMEGCKLSDNEAVIGGAGITNAGILSMSDCTLSGNSAGSGGLGGGILNSRSLSMVDCVIAGNSVMGSGGGVENSGSLSAVDCTFADNAANQGGGVHNSLGTTVAVDCTFAGNSAQFFGGAIENEGGLSATNSTFAGNTALREGGGALFNGRSSSQAALINCTIARNFAVSGGGLLDVNNVAIANTIIGDNSITPGQPGPDVAGPVTSLGNNLISNSAGSVGFGSSDLLDTDPLLGLLQNNGGPTETMALLRGSPAVDAATNPVDGVTVPTTDQRGALRGPAGLNTGLRVDIGAYEDSSSYLVNSTADFECRWNVTLRCELGE